MQLRFEWINAQATDEIRRKDVEFLYTAVFAGNEPAENLWQTFKSAARDPHRTNPAYCDWMDRDAEARKKLRLNVTQADINKMAFRPHFRMEEYA